MKNKKLSEENKPQVEKPSTPMQDLYDRIKSLVPEYNRLIWKLENPPKIDEPEAQKNYDLMKLLIDCRLMQ